MLSCLPIYQRTFYPLEGYFRLLPTSLPSQSGCKDTTTSFTSKYFLIFFTKIFLNPLIHPDYQYFITKFYFKIFCESALCPILFRNSTVRFKSFARMSHAQCKCALTNMIFSSAGAWLCASTRTQEGSKTDSPTRRDTPPR